MTPQSCGEEQSLRHVKANDDPLPVGREIDVRKGHGDRAAMDLPDTPFRQQRVLMTCSRQSWSLGGSDSRATGRSPITQRIGPLRRAGLRLAKA